MTGWIMPLREAGKGEIQAGRLGPLELVVAKLYVPEGLSPRRAARRLVRLERRLERMGVSRVVAPEELAQPGGLRRLRTVETLPLYQGAADVLVLGALERTVGQACRGRVSLSAPWLSGQLRQTARLLCPWVRALRIDVPRAGEDYAAWLQREYGLPVVPPSEPVDVTVAFGPGGRAQGWTLRLYDRPELGGLALAARGHSLPEECAQQLLALLWEAGAVRREQLYCRGGST